MTTAFSYRAGGTRPTEKGTTVTTSTTTTASTTTGSTTTGSTTTGSTTSGSTTVTEASTGTRVPDRGAVARPGHVGRRLAATALVVGAGLNTAEAVIGQLLPAMPDDVAEQIRLVGEHTALFVTRGVVGTLAIPFMAVAFLAAAQRLSVRAPRTGWTAGGLLLAGMWGFVGIHLMALMQLPASGLADPAAVVPFFEAARSEPLLGALFLLPFLVGCFAGLLVLGTGLLVTGAAPRWVAVSWLLFIVLDFTVGRVGPVDPHWLFLAGAVGLAAHVLRHEAPTGRV